MAGRARRNALAEALDRRAKEALDWQAGDAEPNHLDYVCQWIEDGKTAKALCLELTQQLPSECSYAFLMAYLRERYGEDTVEQRLSLSRALSSHAMAEDALEIVDAKAETTVDVSRNASRARSRQWMAEKYNPQTFGQQKQANVSINIGTLHLDALRATANTIARAARARLISPASVAGNVTVGAQDNTQAEGQDTQPVVASRDSDAA